MDKEKEVLIAYAKHVKSKMLCGNHHIYDALGKFPEEIRQIIKRHDDPNIVKVPHWAGEVEYILRNGLLTALSQIKEKIEEMNQQRAKLKGLQLILKNSWEIYRQFIEKEFEDDFWEIKYNETHRTMRQSIEAVLEGI